MLIAIDDLIKARIGLGWTQNELSKHSAVPQQTISLIERKARRPRPITLQKIYKAFINAGWDFEADHAVFPIYSEDKNKNKGESPAKGFSINNMNELICSLENSVTILKDIPIQYLSMEDLQKIYTLAQQQEYIIRAKIPEDTISSLTINSQYEGNKISSYPQFKENEPEDYTVHEQQKEHKTGWQTKKPVKN